MVGALGGREVAGIGLGRRHAVGRCYCGGRCAGCYFEVSFNSLSVGTMVIAVRSSQYAKCVQLRRRIKSETETWARIHIHTIPWQ
jgi:hypothetical protein